VPSLTVYRIRRELNKAKSFIRRKPANKANNLVGEGECGRSPIRLSVGSDPTLPDFVLRFADTPEAALQLGVLLVALGRKA
jgi:hypothetical protein